MNGNIINFKVSDDLKNVTYTNNNGDLGVRSLSEDLSIAKLNSSEFLINDKLIDRETLAEFLWVAATFVDSEEKWRPNLELIGGNY